ncbi:hypothetical protein Tco_0862163 [Tanacetum coccineum]
MEDYCCDHRATISIHKSDHLQPRNLWAIRETVDSLTRIQHEPRINLSCGLKGWIALHYKRIRSRNQEQGWMRMEVLLGIHGAWDVVDPGSDDAKKNNIVKGLLFQSIPEDLVLQIGNMKTERRCGKR